MSNSSVDPELASLVPAWTPTSTMTALQTLVDQAALTPSAVARRAGISTSELHALRHLSDAPLGPAELARRLGVTTAPSSGIVDRLEGHGHVERRQHTQDGRRTEVMLTDSGRRELFRLMAPMFAELAELDATLSDDERNTVNRFLAGATAAMRAVI